MEAGGGTSVLLSSLYYRSNFFHAHHVCQCAAWRNHEECLSDTPQQLQQTNLNHARLTRILDTALPPHHHYRFTALFPGSPGWAGARRELLDFMVQGKINRGRHTDHPAGRHSIRTNRCPPPPSPHFFQAGCPSWCPTNSVKALKATSAFRLGRRC